MMKWFTLVCAVLLVFGASVVASEEEILPTYKLTLVADGRSLGEVAATLEMSRQGEDQRVKRITLRVGGKDYPVPEEQYADLPNPLLHTAEFRTEGGRDSGPPWLYLTFRLFRPGVSLSERPLVYIRFRDGKVLDRSIHDPKTAADPR
jgi:hypothetical protein